MNHIKCREGYTDLTRDISTFGLMDLNRSDILAVGSDVTALTNKKGDVILSRGGMDVVGDSKDNLYFSNLAKNSDLLGDKTHNARQNKHGDIVSAGKNMNTKEHKNGDLLMTSKNTHAVTNKRGDIMALLDLSAVDDLIAKEMNAASKEKVTGLVVNFL